MNAQFITVFVNPRMASLLGYRVDEMLGRNVSDFMDPDEMADNSLKFEERRQGRSDFYERKFRRKDGSLRWFGVSATALKNPDGSFAGSFAMLSDITDRKTAEEDLKRKNEELGAAYEQLTAAQEELQAQFDEMKSSDQKIRNDEQLFRLILMNMQDAYIRTDPEGKISMVNPSAVRMFGYGSEHEMIGQHASILYISPEDREELLRTVQENGGVTNFYGDTFRKDGTRFPVSMNVQILHDTDGRRIGAEAIIRNMSPKG
jgi:PAS domain S-box-containing protein